MRPLPEHQHVLHSIRFLRSAPHWIRRTRNWAKKPNKVTVASAEKGENGLFSPTGHKQEGKKMLFYSPTQPHSSLRKGRGKLSKEWSVWWKEEFGLVFPSLAKSGCFYRIAKFCYPYNEQYFTLWIVPLKSVLQWLCIIPVRLFVE